MKHVAAIVMGFLASGLPYLMSRSLPWPAPIAILLAAWAASGFLLQRGAKTAAQVLARGFLLGAGEWLLLLFAAVGYALLAAPDALTGIAVKGFIMAVMASLCLAGFATLRVWERVKSPPVTELR